MDRTWNLCGARSLERTRLMPKGPVFGVGPLGPWSHWCPQWTLQGIHVSDTDFTAAALGQFLEELTRQPANLPAPSHPPCSAVLVM